MEQKAARAGKPRVKQPPILFDKTQHLIAQIETILGAPLISYWNNPRGAVCHNSSWRTIVRCNGTTTRSILHIA